MAVSVPLTAHASELQRAELGSAGELVGDLERHGSEDLANLVNEGELSKGVREEVAAAAGFIPTDDSDIERSFRKTYTPSPCAFPEELRSFRERLWQAEPARTVSSFIDWSRLIAVETTEALNEVPDCPEQVPASGSSSACGLGSARGLPLPRAVSVEVNSGGQVFFALLSPEPGKDKEEAVVIKFCNSRHMLQSEQMAAELAWHLEVEAPISRLLLKAHDGAEWKTLSSASESLSAELHRALEKKQSMLLLQFIAGSNLRAEERAWDRARLTNSCNHLGRLVVLDMLLGNSDRLPIHSLSWRGNPSNLLWSSCGRCVPIDAVVARRPPKFIIQETDKKVGSVLELALLDRKSAQETLLDAVSCNSAGVSAVEADWAPNEAAWSKKQAGVPEEELPPYSAVKAFHTGLRSALTLALREQGLLEMIVDVIRSWLDAFHADIDKVSKPAVLKLGETRQLLELTREANKSTAVKDRLSSWQALLQKKSCALRQAADEWATRRNVSTAMSFKGFLGDTVLNPIADAYELMVRLQHLVARIKVMAEPGSATRPSDLSPTPLFVGPATSCCFHVLRKLGVTCVLNCTTDLPEPSADTLGHLQWHRLAIEDKEDQDVSAAFEEGLRILQGVAAAGGRTLIHCHEGKSRSVSLCLAYMISGEKRTLADALTFVKSKRPVARPNAGFLSQLLALELVVLGSNSMSPDELPKGKPKLSSQQNSQAAD